MAQLFNEIDTALRAFIERQHIFFVASAPLEAGGHVNLSPKGLDSLRVLGPKTVAYLDYVGSGAETIAHVKQNGRITLMWCAFDGPPRIVRVHGKGEVLDPTGHDYHVLRPRFPDHPHGRAIVVVSVERIADSCGYGVPEYQFQGHRKQLPAWAERKGAEGLVTYQVEKNARSLDGLPAVTWIDETPRPSSGGGGR